MVQRSPGRPNIYKHTERQTQKPNTDTDTVIDTDTHVHVHTYTHACTHARTQMPTHAVCPQMHTAHTYSGFMQSFPKAVAGIT